VFNDQAGCANRATFVVDAEGRVVSTFATASLGTPRARADYEAALAQLG
jgi:peroxiredoxin